MHRDDHSPMRVLQIIGNVCGGGVEAVAMNYYRHIDRRRIQFDFVIDGYEKSLLDDEIASLGGRVYKVERYSKNVLKQIYQIYRIVKDNKYEVVHSHMNTLAVFSLCAAWLGGARIRIVHNHTTATRQEKLRSLLKYMLRPFSRTFANVYLACSMAAGKWMFGDRVETGNVTIVNNAIDVHRFAYDERLRTEGRKRLGIEPDALVVGHVGRFAYQKNHAFLIDIMAKLVKRDATAVLVLIGDGPLMEKIAYEVKQRGLEGNICFLGLQKNVAELYHIMDLFVLPSWYEGLPVVAVEAQANGLPCIVSDRVSKECKLTSSLSFLRLEQSTTAWAEEILRRQGKRNSHAEKELAEAGFDIKTEAGRLQNFYEELVTCI